MLGERRGERWGEDRGSRVGVREEEKERGKTVSNLLIYKGYFLNSKSFSIKPHVFP